MSDFSIPYLVTFNSVRIAALESHCALWTKLLSFVCRSCLLSKLLSYWKQFLVYKSLEMEQGSLFVMMELALQTEFWFWIDRICFRCSRNTFRLKNAFLFSSMPLFLTPVISIRSSLMFSMYSNDDAASSGFHYSGFYEAILYSVRFIFDKLFKWRTL